MKIHICCPGSWSHGLDSPERGEGRWAQNLARLLGEAGHTVYASSGGSPVAGEGVSAENVVLVDQAVIRRFGDFDVNIDPSWWNGKRELVSASIHIHVHYSPEPFVLEPLPKGHCLAYPYRASEIKFIGEKNKNSDRTFLLPIPLGSKFLPPAFNRSSILWPSRGPEFGGKTTYDLSTIEHSLDIIKDLREKNENLKVHWMYWDSLSKRTGGIPIKPDDGKYNSIPYCQVRDITKTCKLSIPVNLPSCVLDCTADGVATVIWERGGFFRDIAQKHNLLIGDGASKGRIREVIETLMGDESIFTQYVLDLQSELADHTNENALKHFNYILDRML